ncbi:MAG TPA: RDD family protein, partial [Edaphobacter sp.]|uniref:RDD family protein n=1 Tax=Edaphobacter sp. TaxID=1934404 RepID=UPI002BCAFF25
MKTSDFRWPFLTVLAAVLILGNLVDSTSLGISAEFSDGHYRIAGGTAPWAIGFSIAIGILYFWLMYAPQSRLTTPMPGIVRRWFAFWIDFILAIMATAPILGLIPSLTEWRRTGVFAWNFERTTPAPSDKVTVTITFMLLTITLMAYYVFPLLRHRPSPGSCVAGYQITPADQNPMTVRRAALRTLIGFVAAATPYLAPFIARDRKR